MEAWDIEKICLPELSDAYMSAGMRVQPHAILSQLQGPTSHQSDTILDRKRRCSTWQ